MKTANCLIEKQKSQLNFILNWATQTTDQEPLEKHHCQRSLKSPDLSAFDSFDLSTSISSLTDNKPNNININIDNILLLSSSFDGSSIYDSLNDLVNTKVNRAK